MALRHDRLDDTSAWAEAFEAQVRRNIHRALRLEDLTQVEAAELVGISVDQFSKAQNRRRRWQMSEVASIARALGLPPACLIAENDDAFTAAYLSVRSSCFSVLPGDVAPPLFDEDGTPWNAVPTPALATAS